METGLSSKVPEPVFIQNDSVKSTICMVRVFLCSGGLALVIVRLYYVLAILYMGLPALYDILYFFMADLKFQDSLRCMMLKLSLNK